MTAVADRLYAMLLEGLLFLGINPVACGAVEMLRWSSLVLIIAVVVAIASHRLAALWLERQAIPLDDERALRLLNDCVRRSRIRYQPRLMQSPAGAAPVFTAGGRRGIIYLHPALAARLDDAELEGVLLHELAHLRERDQVFASWLHVVVFFMFAIAAQAWIIAFFFGRDTLHFGSFRAQIVMVTLLLTYVPIRRFFRRTIGYLREIDCDQSAVRWGARPEDLASALVKTGRFRLEQRSSPSPWLPFQSALAPRHGDLESRVRRLVDERETRLRPRMIVRTFTIAALVCLVLFVVSFHLRSATSHNPPTGWSQIVIP